MLRGYFEFLHRLLNGRRIYILLPDPVSPDGTSDDAGACVPFVWRSLLGDCVLLCVSLFLLLLSLLFVLHPEGRRATTNSSYS